MKYLIASILFLSCFRTNAQTDLLGSTNVDRSVLLVKHRAGTAEADIDELHKQQGGKSKRFKHLRWTAVKVPPGQERRMLENYRKSKWVERVEFNGLVHVDATPNDPLYPQLWGMEKIAAPAAWDRTVSNNVVVAIVDTGIDFNHPDLAANLWTGPNGEHGYTASGGGILPGGMDDHYHGTHVAGTIAGVGNNGVGVAGLNWTGTKLVSFKFLDASGSGTYVDAILCYERMTDLRLSGVNIRVANNSWGGAGLSLALQDAFEVAQNAGILSICAAGNTGEDIDENPFSPASFPLEGVISVLASDDQDNKAYFSSYGLTRTHLLAPGVFILSCKPNGAYQTLSGTSMATPHVAGVCALMFGVAPNLTYRQCKAVLLDEDSLDHVSFTINATSGGRLNAAKAVTNATLPVPPDNHNPILNINGTNLLTVLPSGTASMSASGTDPDAGDRLNYQTILSGHHNDDWLIGAMVPANLRGRRVATNSIAVTNQPTGRDYAMDARFNLTDGHGGLDSEFGTFVMARDEGKVRALPEPVFGLRLAPPYSTPMFLVSLAGVSSNEAKFSWHFSSPSQGVGKSCCFPVNVETTLYNLTRPEPHIYHVQVMDVNGNFTTKRFVTDPGNTGMYVPEAKVKLSAVRGTAPFTVTADMSASDPGGTHHLSYAVSYWIRNGSLSLDGYNPLRTFTLTEPGLHALQFTVYDVTNNLTDMHVELLAVLPTPPPTEPPPVSLTPPNDLRANLYADAIQLSWSDTAVGEDRYDLERRVKMRGKWQAWKPLISVSEDNVGYTFVPLPATQYEFRLKACKDSQCSAYSNVAAIRSQ